MSQFTSSKTVVRFIVTLLAMLMIISASACSASTAVTTATIAPANSEATAAPAAEATVTTAAVPSGPRTGGVMPGGSTFLTSVAPTYQDLAYASISETQKLDIYLPEGDGPFPLVIMIHGGGFMMGDKADGMGLAGVDQLLAAGYAVASINYRLSSEAQYPAQIFDAKAAVRFLRANAAEYKLNPEKFGAWGASAGGTLVALLGTTCGVAELEGAELGNADQSSCVQAVVDWFGPIDFLKLDEQFAGTSCPVDHNEANSPESMLVGAAIQTVPDLVKTTNAMNYISSDDAPFLIQHGSADCNIPPVQGKNLADALSAAIGTDKATYTLIDGAGHGGTEFSAEENLTLVLNFLNSYLK